MQKMQFRSTDYLILSQSELFSDLDITVLTSILQKSEKKQAYKKEHLICQSQPNKSVYLILFGCVKITSIASDGRERISDILGVGDMFGEITILQNSISDASIAALVPSVFMMIDQENFINLVYSYPEMSLKLLRIFARKIERKDQLISDFFFTDVNFRLAKHLLSMTNISIHKKICNGDGASTDEPHDDRRCQPAVTAIKISQQDLANMVGVSRESVNKHLKTWERNGIISLSTGLIDICDADRLAALIG